MESRLYGLIALIVAALFGAIMGALLVPTVMNFFGGGVDAWTGAAIGAVLVLVIGLLPTILGAQGK
jgi:hypothetical protein